MRVLVTGGAGYIGSVVVDALIERGHEPQVIDNLWRGHRGALAPSVPFASVDLRDRPQIVEAVRRFEPDAVMHFAAATLVPESVADPALYFEVNVGGTLNLLAAMRSVGVQRLVFSSTAAVYGIPELLPITESSNTLPVNPYGESKLMVERILAAYAAAYGLRYASFRYFNVAGATERLGEDHDPETHLIPSALLALVGKRPEFALFGTDYPTPDGTAVRDYVHVLDLADAHIAALDHLDRVLGPMNLGTAHGFSVREVVDAIQRVTGRPLPLRREPRRPGDPPALLADSRGAHDVLGWVAVRSTLDQMIGSAWDWMREHPDGYSSPS